jgi:hypothetical protein
MTPNEARMFSDIHVKDSNLRSFFDRERLGDPPDTRSWFGYLTSVREILGNLSNSVSFVATVLAKEYLTDRFDIVGFDAAAKPQGAPGADILVSTGDGETIYCEIKTNKPYQPGFGAQQKQQILKDLKKLADSRAHHRFMLVTDVDAFKALCGKSFAKHAHGIEIVNLLSRESFTHN